MENNSKGNQEISWNDKEVDYLKRKLKNLNLKMPKALLTANAYEKQGSALQIKHQST